MTNLKDSEFPEPETAESKTSRDHDTAHWRGRSLWHDQLTENLNRRPSLPGPITCDVAIIGAGLTGLWIAYYLKTYQPDLNVVILEREDAGFGPSGRNGGWVSSGIAGSARAFGIKNDRALTLRAERETHATVDEIGAVAAREGIECGYRKDGMLTIATSKPQKDRLRDNLGSARVLGLTEDDVRTLNADELRGKVHLPQDADAVFTPHGARVDPARLTRGLARACERLGVQIFEGTEVLEITPGRARCAAGTVTAAHVIRATESYTVEMAKQGRRYLPLYSLMIATEPLPSDVWDEIGWHDSVLIRDSSHLFFYAQRTTDGRIAMGGRGAPYAFGSPISVESERDDSVRRRLAAALSKHFPSAAAAEITHHWGGPLAVPRDWSMSVNHNPVTGLGAAGGYSGHGVVASNIAGRTLADLMLDRESDLVSMPWVGHRSRKWEPEPLRYLASQTIIHTLERVDRIEESRGRSSRSELLVRPFMPGH